VSDLKVGPFSIPFATLGVDDSNSNNAAPTFSTPNGGALNSVGQWGGDEFNPLTEIFGFVPGFAELFAGQTNSAAAAQHPGLIDLLGKVIGLFVPQAQTSASGHVEKRAQAQTHASFQSGGVSGKASASAEAYATASATGRAWAGPTGVGAQGSAEASVGVKAQTAGELHTPVGSIRGYAGASAEIYARGQAYVMANHRGADAGATAEVGATAKAEANASANLMGGLVTGQADATAEAGTGATATGRVGLSFDPPKAVVHGSAGAFAGARAGFSAMGGVGPLKYGVEAEAWAGVGVKAEFHAGIDDGKFRFSAGLGAALGIGAFLKVDFEIDFRDVGSAITGIIGAGAAIVGGVVSAVGGAIGAVAKGIGDFFGNIFKGIANLFGGGKGDGSHALNLLETFKPLFTTPPELPKLPDPVVSESEDAPQEPKSPKTQIATA
jgi:hypothetical protein